MFICAWLCESPSSDKQIAPHFLIIKSTTGAGGNSLVMEKRFVIISIEDVINDGRKATIRPSEEPNGRIRILNLNPLRKTEASGTEIDKEGLPIANTVGYLLKGNKPLSNWESGDVVSEEVFPEEWD